MDFSGPALASLRPQHSFAPKRAQDPDCLDLMTPRPSSPAAASPPATIQMGPEFLRNGLVKGFRLIREIKAHSLYCNIRLEKLDK